MTASTLAATAAVSPGSRIPASSRASRRAAARPASRGVPGSAPAAVKSARMSWLAVARSQRRSPGRRLAWRASMRDSSSSWAACAPVGPLRHREALAGVGGVGALVDQGAPGDRVALAVGGAGGVAVVGVCSQQVAVDLDDRDAGEVAGGVAEAGSGGAGDRDRAAGDRGDLGGHGVGELLPVAGGAASPAGGGGGGAVADIGGGPFRLRRAGARSGGRGRGGRPPCGRRLWLRRRLRRRGPPRGRCRPGWRWRRPRRGCRRPWRRRAARGAGVPSRSRRWPAGRRGPWRP